MPYFNPFKKGSQGYRLFEALKDGPLTNYQIVKDLGILNYTGRISDLRKFGLVDKPKRLGNGVFEYRLAI